MANEFTPTSVSVCFPAYNEEQSIRDVVMEADRLLSSAGLDYEILVCDDGSRDRTGSIIDELTNEIPGLRVFHHEENRGIQPTFEHLYREAGKEFVFLNSTDGQWHTGIVLDMLPLTREYDVIIGKRIKKHYGFGRTVVSWMYNLTPFILFGVRTYDAGAVKLLRRAIIDRWRLVSKSPFAEAERLIRASRAGYRIVEHPVHIDVRRSGKGRGANPRLVAAAARDVLRVWFALQAEHLHRLRPKNPTLPR